VNTTALATALLVLSAYLYVATLAPDELSAMFDKDIARLSTMNWSVINGTRLFELHVIPFSGTAKCTVVLYLSPFELRTFNEEVNTLVRLLISNSANVTLFIVGGPKFVMPSVGTPADAGYCWGPSCPSGDVGYLLVKDNSHGSYQFLLKLTAPYGSISLIANTLLLAHGFTQYRELTEGVWLNDTYLFLGDPNMPFYAYDPLKASSLLLALCEGRK